MGLSLAMEHGSKARPRCEARPHARTTNGERSKRCQIHENLHDGSRANRSGTGKLKFKKRVCERSQHDNIN